MRTAARADRFVGGFSGAEARRPDRSCEMRRGAAQGRGQATDRGTGEPVREIWSEQDSRGLTARELIRLAQAVRLRPGRD
ncbi:hypothetical protein FF100_16110 [Methylobacterium terricola]|uniref:Uncharacterized protein n=1 Tax=Methylobacterium terricola TaxID=2583531 RepID=A0A5C4LH82_9HYPH|nr:hypothetical protein FF100_16110 [Methylobacterium terricola]